MYENAMRQHASEYTATLRNDGKTGRHAADWTAESVSADILADVLG